MYFILFILKRVFATILCYIGSKVNDHELDLTLMNTSEIKKLHELLKDLLEFLQKHRGQQNINYFTNTILDMMDILEYMCQNPDSHEYVDLLRRKYNSMFFPREGLSDFYVMDSDSHRMREYNTQLSDLLEEIHQTELLKNS